MNPIHILSLLLFLASAWAVIATLDARGRLPISIFGRHLFFFAASSERGRNTLAMLLRNFNTKPIFKLDAPNVKRAIMQDGIVINYTDPDVHELLGNAGSGLGIIVKNPLVAAKKAAFFLKINHFSEEIILGETIDPTAEPNKFVFVRTDALKDAVLVFARHPLKSGARPPFWK
jgi:hypothetical protein